MQIQLKPELEKYIDSQVKAGRFASATEALEAGVARIMLDPEPDVMPADEATAIRESLEEMRRGEVMDWAEFSAPFRPAATDK